MNKYKIVFLNGLRSKKEVTTFADNAAIAAKKVKRYFSTSKVERILNI